MNDTTDQHSPLEQIVGYFALMKDVGAVHTTGSTYGTDCSIPYMRVSGIYTQYAQNQM